MIDCLNRQRRERLPLDVLRARAQRALEELGLGQRSACLVLVSDRAMRRLNREWRGLDQPTNVLAFAGDEGPAFPEPEVPLGDVVISVETARREAAEGTGVQPQQAGAEVVLERVTWLMVHGLLHLAGYDHGDDAQEARMEARAAALGAALLAIR
jgi:probable rRNA maturation factor